MHVRTFEGGGEMTSNMKFKVIIFTILSAMLIAVVIPNILHKSPVVFANDVSNSSTIGGIEVGSLKEEDLKSLLANAVVEWQSAPLEVQGGGSILQLDCTLITFDIDKTIASFKSMTKKPWYAFWQKEKVVHVPLEIGNFQPIIDALNSKSEWEIEETTSRVLAAASMLKNEPVEAVMIDPDQFENERIAVSIQPIPETTKGVYELATKLDRTIVGPGETFNLIEAGAEVVNKANAEGLSFVASLLFSNAIHTNTEIVEQHTQKEIPTYFEPGLEAFISLTTNENLQFINRSEQTMLLRLSLEANNLKVEFFTAAKTDSVSVRVVQADEVNPREIVRYSKDLAIGQQRVLQEGSKGLRVFVYRTINGEEEDPIRTYYAPVNRIIVKSSRVAESSTSGNRSTDLSPENNEVDGDLNIDLNNDGLPDVEGEKEGTDSEPDDVIVDEEGNKVLPEGWYYDKAGNLIKK